VEGIVYGLRWGVILCICKEELRIATKTSQIRLAVTVSRFEIEAYSPSVRFSGKGYSANMGRLISWSRIRYVLEPYIHHPVHKFTPHLLPLHRDWSSGLIVLGVSLNVIRLVQNWQRCTARRCVTLPTESDIFPKWSVEESNFKVLWVCVICGRDHVVLSRCCFTLISELLTRCRVLLEKLLVPQLARTCPIIAEP